MADGFILSGNTLIPAFIYEGERIAIEYPDGVSFEVPPSKVHIMLHSAIAANGEECHILMEKSPITRLPLVVLD